MSAEKVKVVWIARQLPAPAESGDRIYSSGLAVSLAKAGATVTFFGLVDPEATERQLENLSKYVQWFRVPGRSYGRLRTLASNLPLEAKRYATPRYRAVLRRYLKDHDVDVVVLDHYSAVWALPSLKGLGLKIVSIAHNFETDLSLQIASDYRGKTLMKKILHLNAKRTARAERKLVGASSVIVALTEADRSRFEQLGARNSLTLTPGYSGKIAPAEAAVPKDHRVVLLGSYRWVAKQMNLRAFLTAADVRFAAAGIKLDVIGVLPKQLHKELSVGLKATRLLGFLDDPSPILQAARIGVVPEATGGGFKLKILDYTFQGLLVAGLRDALEGVPPTLRQHCLSADTLDDLVALICSVIFDDELIAQKRMGALISSLYLFNWRSRGAELLAALRN